MPMVIPLFKRSAEFFLKLIFGSVALFVFCFTAISGPPSENKRNYKVPDSEAASVDQLLEEYSELFESASGPIPIELPDVPKHPIVVLTKGATQTPLTSVQIPVPEGLVEGLKKVNDPVDLIDRKNKINKLIDEVESLDVQIRFKKFKNDPSFLVEIEFSNHLKKAMDYVVSPYYNSNNYESLISGINALAICRSEVRNPGQKFKIENGYVTQNRLDSPPKPETDAACESDFLKDIEAILAGEKTRRELEQQKEQAFDARLKEHRDRALSSGEKSGYRPSVVSADLEKKAEPKTQPQPNRGTVYDWVFPSGGSKKSRSAGW